MGGLKVASWPGSGGDLNPFINIFVDALEGIGCEVVNVKKFPAKDFPEVSVLVIHWPQFIYKESFGKFVQSSHFVAIPNRPPTTEKNWCADCLDLP